MVKLQKQSVYWRGNGHTEVVLWRENSHVRGVVSFIEGEWSFYRGVHFNGGRVVMLQR